MFVSTQAEKRKETDVDLQAGKRDVTTPKMYTVISVIIWILQGC